MYRGWWALGAGKPGSGAAGPGKARGLRKKGVDLGTAGSEQQKEANGRAKEGNDCTGWFDPRIDAAQGEEREGCCWRHRHRRDCLESA
jgi:hypothetical protein